MNTTVRSALARAQGFMGRMTLAGVSPNPIQRRALDRLVTSLENIGLDRFAAIYPMIGGTAATHALDLLDNYPITWNGTVTHDETGITGDASTGYGDTGFIASSSIMGLNSVHLSIYQRAQTASTSGISFGVQDASSRVIAIAPARADRTQFVRINSVSTWSTNPDNNRMFGMYVGNRSSAGNQELWKLGTKVIDAAVSPDALPTTYPFYILGRNNAGTLDGASNNNIAFATIGAALTDAQIVALTNAVDRFQTDLERNVSLFSLFNDRVTAAGVALDSTQREAVSDLCDDLINGNILGLFNAVYPLVGGTAAAHALDLMGHYDITWSGGLTHNSTGVTSDGSTGYGNTNLNLADAPLVSAASGHMSIYVSGSLQAGSNIQMGLNSPAQVLMGWVAGGTLEGGQWTGTAGAYAGAAPSDNGFFCLSRTGANLTRYFDDSGQRGSDQNAASSSIGTDPVFLLSTNIGSLTPGGFSTRTSQFHSIGVGLSNIQVDTLRDAVHAYQTALGRLV